MILFYPLIIDFLGQDFKHIELWLAKNEIEMLLYVAAYGWFRRPGDPVFQPGNNSLRMYIGWHLANWNNPHPLTVRSAVLGMAAVARLSAVIINCPNCNSAVRYVGFSRQVRYNVAAINPIRRTKCRDFPAVTCSASNGPSPSEIRYSPFPATRSLIHQLMDGKFASIVEFA